MATVPCGDTPAELAPTATRSNAALNAVLSSSAFQRAPLLSRLLIYLDLVILLRKEMATRISWIPSPFKSVGNVQTPKAG
jgi:hypothetical protein